MQSEEISTQTHAEFGRRGRELREGASHVKNTGASATASHVRERLRRRYFPNPVRILFVGESPPVSGRFFYQADKHCSRKRRNDQISFRRFFTRTAARVTCRCLPTRRIISPRNSISFRPSSTSVWHSSSYIRHSAEAGSRRGRQAQSTWSAARLGTIKRGMS